MSIPRARGKRLEIYLSDEIYSKAIKRYRNLDAKIEQLLRYEIEREEGADAAHGFGSVGMSKPISQIVQEEANAPRSASASKEAAGATFFEMNPELVDDDDAPPAENSTRLGKRDRLPVFKRKRRGN